MSSLVGPRRAVPIDVPVLRPGIDPMPTRCGQCGARGPHNAEPPLDGDPHGIVTCRSCGRLLAWLLPLPPTRVRPAPEVAIAPSRPAVPLSEPDWRLPGCGIACQRRMHDPWQHEAHARQEALAEVEARAERPTGVVRTGPLAIDFDAYCAFVDGVEVSLTPTEFRLLSTLALDLGRTCLFTTLVRLVWGDDQAQLGEPGRHILRVTLARLRPKLGPAARLVRTVPTIGVRLLNEPVP